MKRQAPKIRRKGAGTAEFRNGHWWTRVSLQDGTRPRYRLCLDVCTCASMTDAMVAERSLAISGRKRGEVSAQMTATEKARREKQLTVQQFGEMWTSGKLLERFGEVKGLRAKASAKDDEYRLKRYVYPEIGTLRVIEVTELDVEQVMAATTRRKRGKRPLRQASRYQLYQVMRRLFDLAVRPGRLREDSPVSEYLRPGRDSHKLFGYLYPAELLTLLKCPDVPIGRRVLYALAVYTGLRKGSLYALTWAGVDFDHGTLTSLHSKTGLPQLFEIPPTLLELLAKWFEFRGRPGKAGKVVHGIEVRAEREAMALRDDLAAAGVKRHEAPEDADNVQPLRFHDLRATFVTWAMRQGRGDGWISDRTGHLTPEMRGRYARAARVLADLRYEPFPSLGGAIPELWDERANVRSIATARKGRGE